MGVFSDKICALCNKAYIPTSPKQKVCINCKSISKALAQKERDRKRNRLKHSTIYKRTCPSCNITFETYDNKKVYCGSSICDTERKRINRLEIDKRRTIERSKINKLKHFRKQGEILKSIKNFINSEGYTLVSARKYKTTHNSELILRCSFGHLWSTTFHNFKDNNNRCAVCYQQNNYISKPEQLVRSFLENYLPYIKVVYNDRSVLNPKELDFYFPDNNLAIEVCGLYWHGETSSGKSREYHYNKMQACYERGVRLITIFEDEVSLKPELVFSRIRQALGEPLKRIYARKCELKMLDSTTANVFFTSNHIQGKSTAVVAYGLYYNDELVCVGSLGKSVRKHTSSATEIEFKRFCTLEGVSVIGGVGKIFKVMKQYAIDNNYKTIKSYCDMRYANIFKPVYEVIGFSLLAYTKYTPHYFKGQKRFRNISLRKTVEERLTGFTEWELRKAQGYDRIWDCGHRTYVYNLNNKLTGV